MTTYSQGICGDGAAILKDGQQMNIEEILSELINKSQQEDLKQLHKALHYMYLQHLCGCGNPACNRCEDDCDNGELLSDIQEKYKLGIDSNG